MNDKVEQLVKRAGWVNWTNDDNWIHPFEKERGYLTLNDLNKLVALVANECIDIVNETQSSNDTINRIKETFNISNH